MQQQQKERQGSHIGTLHDEAVGYPGEPRQRLALPPGPEPKPPKDPIHWPSVRGLVGPGLMWLGINLLIYIICGAIWPGPKWGWDGTQSVLIEHSMLEVHAGILTVLGIINLIFLGVVVVDVELENIKIRRK